jgi:peptide chain release factor 1
MLDKLKSVEARFEEINQKLYDPDIMSDMENYQKLMRELKRLTPVVEKFREYSDALTEMEEAKGLWMKADLTKIFGSWYRKSLRMQKARWKKLRKS